MKLNDIWTNCGEMKVACRRRLHINSNSSDDWQRSDLGGKQIFKISNHHSSYRDSEGADCDYGY